jgi:hypothetical protein
MGDAPGARQSGLSAASAPASAAAGMEDQRFTAAV